MIDWASTKFKITLTELIQEIESVAEKKNLGDGFKFGQKEAVWALYERMLNHGAILADEVGLGKTRVALILMEAVLRMGGTVAAVVPSGLMFQWETEAYEFAKFLERPHITQKILKLSGFNDLFSQASEATDNQCPYPLTKNNGNNCQWTLISHYFGPILANTKNDEKYSFFKYIWYRFKTEMTGIKWTRFINQFNDDLANNLRKKKKQKFIDKSKIIAAVDFLNLEKDYDFNSEEDNLLSFDNYSKWLNQVVDVQKKCEKVTAKSSKRFSRYVIGKLVGNIDFLIIDEAHKGKASIEETREDGTRLTNLLDQTLNYSLKKRKLCLTATPVELSVENWSQILKRCDIKDVCTDVFENFHRALKDVRINPSNEKIVKTLEECAKEFQKTLQPFVVRRLRCHQDEYKELVKGFIQENSAHVHRKSQIEHIDVSSNPNWQKAIMCFEGAAWAAKGINDVAGKGAAEKLLQCRYPTGIHDIPDDFKIIDLKSIKNPKEKRKFFWEMQAAAFIKSSRETEIHPRVDKTADLIEKILEKNECNKFLSKECEKVLVFGINTKPMEQLRDELNRRNYVRRVISGKLIQQNIVDNEEKDNIYSTYKRLFKDGKLASDKNHCLKLSKNSFFSNASALYAEYIKYQSDVLKIINDKNDSLASYFDLEECFSLEKETHEFKKICFFTKKYDEKKELYEDIITWLKNGLLGWLIDEFDHGNVVKSVKKMSRETIRRKLKVLARGFYQDLQDSIKLSKGKQKEEIDSVIRDNDIYKYLHDDGNGAQTNRSSKFCRLMDGRVEGNVRRKIQRQFNTPRMSPKVLIAQSQVGREGLNLHKCCRHVVLFHSEWNPGTVEQEIGRVDRINSLWNRVSAEWQKHNPQGESKENECPRIEVHFMVFDGTYDQLHFEVLNTRIQEMNAHLFGSLLDFGPKADGEIEISDDIMQRLKKAAPDFDPCNK